VSHEITHMDNVRIMSHSLMDIDPALVCHTVTARCLSITTMHRMSTVNMPTPYVGPV